jgi:hypothetical protein
VLLERFILEFSVLMFRQTLGDGVGVVGYRFAVLISGTDSHLAVTKIGCREKEITLFVC